MPRARTTIAAVALPLATALTLFVLNGWNAYHPTDDGFVLAYSWRILHGEVPYRDFLYVRTPLTLYLHALELLLPDGWAIQAGRLAFYVELAASAALPGLWVASRLRTVGAARVLGVAAIFFLFAAHNFPPMPWPTVDAVFFSSAALAALLFSIEASPKRALALRVLASILVALAVLAKQTFAPLALLLVVDGAVRSARGRSWWPFLASAVPGLAVAATATASLAAASALPEAVQQILGSARLRPTVSIPWSGDPVTDGVLPYLRAVDPLSALLMIAAFALALRSGASSGVARAASLALMVGVVVMAFEAQWDVFMVGRRLWWILLALLAGDLARRDEPDRRNAFALAAALALAWCSSLSFAYQTPLLGLAPATLLMARAVATAAWPPASLGYALVAAVVATSVVRLDLERPYRDVSRAGQVADLGGVYGRFGHLYSNETNMERFRELRDLVARYADPAGPGFVVVPDYPLIHYLSGTRTPISIDWFQPQEYVGEEDRLARELATRRPIVIVQRDPSLVIGATDDRARPCGDPPDPQPLIVEVVTRWQLATETAHFCAYRAP